MQRLRHHPQSAPSGPGRSSGAAYGCFLPDLTRFTACRRPDPLEALNANVSIAPFVCDLRAEWEHSVVPGMSR